MKRLGSIASFALAVLSVLVFAGPAAAGEQVPFKGRFEGTVSHTPAPPFDSVLVEATGNASHLGRFAVAIPHLVNLATRTAAGTYEFTAANGDKLFADFVGHSTPTDVPNVIAIVETATITGGTGRFAGATGSFTTQRLFDRAALTTAGSFEGTIQLGASDNDAQGDEDED
jgi:hypothetical protein